MGTFFTGVLLACASAQDASAQDEPACARTAAGCSAYSAISAGTCATTAGCEAIQEETCRELHTFVDIPLCVATLPRPSTPPLSSRMRVCLLIMRARPHSDPGNGHVTVGQAQQNRFPAGCVLYGSRHKYNTNLGSTVLCSQDTQCICAGDCAPLPMSASAKVEDTRGTCSPSAMSQSRLDVISTTCCGAGGDDAATCDAGLPDMCSDSCAAVYLPLFHVCSNELEVSMGPAARSFAASCHVCCPRPGDLSAGSTPSCMADPEQMRELIATCADESPGFHCPIATSAEGLGPLECWDTSCAVDFRGLFRNAGAFDVDITNWDTSAAYTMEMMFQGASSFNQDISAWDVSAVTSMAMMFFGASIFNQDISSWDVGAVTTTRMMFAQASSFDRDLSPWNIWAATDMSRMFYGSAQSTMMIGDAWSAQSWRNIDSMYERSCCTSPQACVVVRLPPSPSPPPLFLCAVSPTPSTGH